jgi:hypothetical protein
VAANSQILSDLRLMKDNAQAIDLMNTYKGVPFVSRCRILNIDADQVTVQSKDFSLVCLLKEGRTRLLGSDFFEPASAHVDAVDLLAGTAVLSGLSYLGAKLGERMIIRVEPPDPIPATIRNSADVTQGLMVDISLSGMGVQIASEQYTPMLTPGANLHVLTELPTSPIEMDGIILSAIRRSDSYRLSVRFQGEHPYKALIFRYLIDRRTEIEADLRQDFYRLRSEARQVS